MNIDERRVRELAHQIWESEGRPEGQAERHWRMARSLAEAEQEQIAQREAPGEAPEKPALLQKPPRRKGKLPAADPERPDEG
ncbi:MULTISPECIES: DUF2934 domain-containing protein [Pseudomonas]|uniref:DUF2934 domain-containing protein n=1 Tax=Pseudomonas delhiensis TaxID=366289 RepID=A0A239LVI2_9PSED|nr:MULTISPECIES: DUF2934 domain-containing protein [Pseudomonas]PWU25957.1 DUF2934 domain-containing protein [Pseudomonas sp. RW407]SDI25826.1 Protein of unknown function [Pseudomonas delhiensis]SNT34260.1 Protein of unknown function [Pseudomonas delhiensis]